MRWFGEIFSIFFPFNGIFFLPIPPKIWIPWKNLKITLISHQITYFFFQLFMNLIVFLIFFFQTFFLFKHTLIDYFCMIVVTLWTLWFKLLHQVSWYFGFTWSFVKPEESILLTAESFCNEGNLPKPVEVEDKAKEQKPKEKDRSKSKYSGKSIQELDLSDCERCTPSYRLLPEDVWI